MDAGERKEDDRDDDDDDDDDEIKYVIKGTIYIDVNVT
jgi:hypothetical protein